MIIISNFDLTPHNVVWQGNVHEVNPRDKVIIASMTERWLSNGGEPRMF